LIVFRFMKSFLECVPCILRQVEEIGGRLFQGDSEKRESLRAEASKILKSTDIRSMTPPEATSLVHHALSRLTGIDDFYKEIKKENNDFALSLYPKLEDTMEASKDRMMMAIRLAIAGNIIDYGAHSTFDVNASIKEAVNNDFMINDYEAFKRDLSRTGKVMFVGDNAGEIVFDKLLVKELINDGKDVCYAVKSKAILNDALISDAVSVSMAKIARVIESGSETAGTLLASATPEFRKAYDDSGIVIAKGQGNLETLEDQGKRIYFLLKCKCEHLAKRLRCMPGAIILLGNSNARYDEFQKEDFCVA